MPPGYSSRCKVCNSPQRTKVEAWVKDEGVSYREAARRLADLGEMVSHEGVRNHLTEHFDVRAEARLQYEASKQQLQAAGAKAVDAICAIDAVIARAARLNAAVAAALAAVVGDNEKEARRRAGDGYVLPRAAVELFTGTANEIRQGALAKQRLLGDDPESRQADALQTWADLVAAAAAKDGGCDDR